jgi:hypothetical protein
MCCKRLLLVVGIGIVVQFAAGSCAAPPAWDNFSDTWVATDDLGRTLPTAEAAGLPRRDRTVAMFYFLWHDQPGSSHGPFDVSSILASDPKAMQKVTSPPWGPLYAPHHWGQSIFGYYLGDDACVLRKHAQMLSDAGVDLIIFDTSNGPTYPHNYQKLFEVFAEVRRLGNRTPQVAFLAPFGNPRAVVAELYRNLYSKHLGEELWFRWDGKPLLLADPNQVDPQARAFFTFRKPQPSYFEGPIRSDMWSWLEVYPQHVFRNSAGEKEQISVGVAQNAVGNRLGSMSEPGARGRSFHDGRQAGEPDAVRHGYNLAEQCRRALDQDPRAVFITGWNEWIAGRFPEFNSVRTPPMFVDQFDQEHSRDIEPMCGGHGDDYFYQAVDFIRRYKGVRQIPAITPRPIQIDGRFDDWRSVEPEYRDTIGDPVQRNHPGWGAAGPYVNTTGRNDLVAAKVSFDSQNVYFYVRTRQPITPPTDPNWMMLLIDADHNPATGWLGYDLIVNRAGIRPQLTTVERSLGKGYRWGSPVDVPYRVWGNELELAIPRAVLGIGKLPATIDFKWADNIQQTGQASDFTLNGDVAPNDRFNYRARLVEPVR